MTELESPILSERQAFDAMRCFLQKYWDRFPEAALADVLSDTQPAFFADTVTADPAMWHDWVQAVQEAVGRLE